MMREDQKKDAPMNTLNMYANTFTTRTCDGTNDTRLYVNNVKWYTKTNKTARISTATSHVFPL